MVYLPPREKIAPRAIGQGRSATKFLTPRTQHPECDIHRLRSIPVIRRSRASWGMNVHYINTGALTHVMRGHEGRDKAEAMNVNVNAS